MKDKKESVVKERSTIAVRVKMKFALFCPYRQDEVQITCFMCHVDNGIFCKFST